MGVVLRRQQEDKTTTRSRLPYREKPLLEGHLLLRVPSHLTGTHPLKDPYLPNWGFFLLAQLFILPCSLLVLILPLLFSISFLFRLASFYMVVPLIGQYFHKKLANNVCMHVCMYVHLPPFSLRLLV